MTTLDGRIAVAPRIRGKARGAQAPTGTAIASRIRAEAALATIVVCVRVTLVIWRPPTLTIDESAQFAISRFLSGRGRWSLFDLPTWQPGLGTTLAPLEALGAGQHTLFRSALVANCIFGGLAAVWLARILSLLMSCAPRHARWVAGGVALIPASVSGSAFIWGDAAVCATFLAVVWFALRLVRTWSVSTALAMQAAAVVGYLYHDRMLPVAVIVIAASIYTAVRRGGAAWLVSGFGLSAVAVVETYTRWVTANVWEDPSAQNSVRSTLGRLWPPADLLHTLIGQTWYTAVGTLGVGVLGATVLVASCRGAEWGVAHVRRHDAVVVLGLVLPMFLTSVLFMSGRDGRADFVIYGRYNDAVMPVVVGVGVLALLRLGDLQWPAVARAAAAPALVILATTLWIGVARGEELRHGWVVFTMVPAVVAIAGSPSIEVFSVGLAALVGFGVLAMSTRTSLRTLLPAIVAVTLLVAGNVRYFVPRVQPLDGRRGVAALISSVVPAGSTIAVRNYDAAPRLPAAMMQRVVQPYQFWLSDYTFTPADLEALPEYVLSLPEDAALAERGGIVVWQHPASIYAVWRVD